MHETHIKAKKSLGQNFLIDHEALSDIESCIEIHEKHIIEVGPGYGALTDYILRSNPASLDLVELDSDMVKLLEKKLEVRREKFEVKNEETEKGGKSVQLGAWREDTVGTMMKDSNMISEASAEGVWLPTNSFDTFGTKSTNNTDEEKMKIQLSMGSQHNSETRVTPIKIYHQDILTFTPKHQAYSVIANIPYYITSPILFHFLYDLSNPPEAMVIMMQKEVGEKILEGRARKPHHSFISLAMEQACDDIERVRYVGRESFDPPPKVDSIVLKFSGKKDRDSHLEKQLLSLWKVAFAHPRKTLLSNMKGSTYDVANFRKIILELGYDERVRAEAIKREDWERFL